MACETCLQAPAVEFKHLGKLCKGCFIDVIQKRARKAVLDYGGIPKGAKVHIVDNKTLKGKVSEQLFKEVVKGLPVEFVQDWTEITVLALTADDLAEGFLNDLFSGAIPPKTRFLSLVKHITDDELLAYARLQNIPGELPPKSDLRQKLDELEKKYPGLKFGLIKSREDLP
jgi:hypothetical protein